MGTVAPAGARLPLSTIEEVTLLARELVESDKALVPVPQSDAVPCGACFERTRRVASWVIEGTARFYCEECVDAARQYGLIERKGEPKTTAAASAGAARVGQRSLLANYAEASRTIFHLINPSVGASREALAKRGVHLPSPDTQVLWNELKKDVGGVTLLLAGLVDGAMRDATPFILPEDVSELLALTDNARLDADARLPFAKCWLDGRFRNDDLHRSYLGVLAVETRDDLPPIPVGASREDVERTLAEKNDIPHSVTLITVYEDDDGTRGLYGITRALSKTRTALVLHPATPSPSRKEMRFLADVLQNWLDLLDSPQVTREDVRFSRRDADNHRRATGTVAPSRVVRIRIVDHILRASIAQFREGRAHYSHRFRVKGHKRVLRAERWRESRGKLVWIAPYYKGHGILVEKVYEVEPLQPAPSADDDAADVD